MVLQAVEANDPRGVLEALRRELAKRIPEASDRDLPALVLRLTVVEKELAGLKPVEGGAVDDLAARRKKRRSDSAAQ